MKAQRGVWAAWAQALGPVRVAFLGSLLLSFVAVQGHLVNRDGIFYLEMARAILDGGFGAVVRVGEWNLLPLLIAALSGLTKVSLETTAHILNAFFLAGACGLLVAWVRRRAPEAAWAACLVVLALPAYNQYRNEILREYGFWFFSMLAFWLAMRWAESSRWRDVIACQCALAVAAMFRLEALAFFPALMLWQAFSAPAGSPSRWRRAILIGGLPLLMVALALALSAMGLTTLPQRAVYYLDAANPMRTLQIIHEAASRMSDTVFQYKYSREEAGYVLFFGLLSIIPVKFLHMCGVFLVPLAYQLAVQPARQWLARWQPLPWIFLAYLLVLAAFVTYQFFLVGRYVSFLNLLAVPLIAVGLALLLRRLPRWKIPIIALALLTMAANVISSSPRKSHIVDAGRWLAANVADHGQVCLSNSRIAHYAGWNSSGIVFESPQLEKMISAGRCTWTATEIRKKEDIHAWLQENRLQEVRRFENTAGDAVVIARLEGPQPAPAAPSR